MLRESYWPRSPSAWIKYILCRTVFQFGWVVIDDLEIDGNLTASCEVLQIPYMACAEDTVRTTAWMEGHKLGCVVVLGGDGTSHAATRKSLKNVPLVAVSTGTNNVYPDYTEGTVAGMAAGITAGADDPEPFCLRASGLKYRSTANSRISLL